MASCLGIYLEDNLIKYAKIDRDKEKLKVESFGIKFYDDLKKTLEQIVKETYSFSTPVSINIFGEQYFYADLFSRLSNSDFEKAINTEFEFFCDENKKRKNALDFRTIRNKSLDNPDKKTVMYSYIDTSAVLERKRLIESYKINNISPMATTITNILPKTNKENTIIVNIEKDTDVTTVVDGTPFKVDKIDIGMKQIFDKIKEKEASETEIYEICKNSTIYTNLGQNLQIETNEYLEDIVPFLYNIIQEVKKIIQKNEIEISKIYITGLATSINNLDLLFQENFKQQCEILVPYFVDKTNVKINVKDYVEVNSAIALAMQTKEQNNINFGDKLSGWQKIKDVLTSDVGSNKTLIKKEKNNNFTKERVKEEFKKDLDKTEKNLLRVAMEIILVIIAFATFSIVYSNQTNDKLSQTTNVIEDAENRIADLQSYDSLIKTRTAEYQKVVDEVKEKTESRSYTNRNALPDMLTEVMAAIPKNLQILSIENTTSKHVVIEVQSTNYSPIGYFKAALQNDTILLNVTSTPGVKTDDVVKVKIEGDLP